MVLFCFFCSDLNTAKGRRLSSQVVHNVLNKLVEISVCEIVKIN